MEVNLIKPFWFWNGKKPAVVKRVKVSKRTPLVVVNQTAYVVIPFDYDSCGILFEICESEEDLKNLGLQYERVEWKQE